MNNPRSPRYLAALFFLSAACIALEIYFMRFFAVYLWSGLGAMVIAVAMLGFAFAGVILAFIPRLYYPAALRATVILIALCVSATPIFIQLMPVNPILLPVGIKWWWPLFGLYAALMAPFCAIAVFTGLIFKTFSHRTGMVYACNLSGAGIGGLIAYISAAHVMPQTIFVMITALTIVGILCVLKPLFSRITGVLIITLCAALTWLSVYLQPETPYHSYKDITAVRALPQAHTQQRTPTAWGLIEIIQSPHFHDLPGLLIGGADALPKQQAIFLDGNSMGAITPYIKNAAGIRTLSTLVFERFQKDHTLIVGSGGGWPLLQSEQFPHRQTTVVEPVALISEYLQSTSRFQNTHSELRFTDQALEPFLSASPLSFDLIFIPVQSFSHPSASRVHVVETYTRLLDRLSSDGVLAIEAPVQLPPREGLRALSTAVTAARAWLGGATPRAHLIAYRHFRQMVIVIKQMPWTPDEIRDIDAHLGAKHIDWIVAPGIGGDRTNRFNVLPEPYFHMAAAGLLDQNPDWDDALTFFDVRPPTRKRPFVNAYMRWSRIRDLVQTFGSRAIAYLQLSDFMNAVIFIQLCLGGLFLLFIPLLFLRRHGTSSADSVPRTLLYFCCLGLAYIAIEMALIQYMSVWIFSSFFSAAAFVISSLLVFSGIGSLITEKWAGGREKPHTIALICLIVAALVALAWLGLFHLSEWLRGLSDLARPFALLIFMAPLGIVMGMPFPSAMRVLLQKPHSLWAWGFGMNGFFSVIAAPLCVLSAAAFGFDWIFYACAFLYLCAGLLWPR